MATQAQKIYRFLSRKRLGYGVSTLGRYAMHITADIGGIAYLTRDTVLTLFGTKLRWQATLEQMHKIGVTSFPLVFLTALFTGIVLAFQSAYQLQLFGATQFTADLVAVSISRELGPVLAAMVVAGRVGAAIAAELGTMKVTEQVDALRSLATDPIRYLVVPRFAAGVVMMFILTVYADIIGLMGGFMICVMKLEISPFQFFDHVAKALMVKDVMTGLIKSFFFGGIITIVGCFFGFQASGGAEGVGQATKVAVVGALILIISADAVFTALFYFI